MSLGRLIRTGAVRYERAVKHPRERVWEAIADKAQRDLWLIPDGHVEMQRGGRFSFMDDMRGTVTECAPGSYIGLDFGDGIGMHFVLDGALRGFAGGTDDACALTFEYWKGGDFRGEEWLLAAWHVKLDALVMLLDGSPADAVHGVSLSQPEDLVAAYREQVETATDTYVVDVDLPASRSRVWDAITDSRELERWFCEHAEVDLDAKRYDFWGRYTQGVPTRDEGRREVLLCEPEERLRFAWHWRGGDTTVQLTLEGIDGGTRLRVSHRDVPLRVQGGEHQPRHLWSHAFACLRAYLEHGETGPRFDYSWPHMGGFTVGAEVAAARAEVYDALAGGWSQASPMWRPARTPDEDFVWDVGALIGIKVLDVAKPDRYVLEWNDGRPTVLTYTLEDSGGGTRITLVHSGFGPDEDIQGMAEGFFSGLVDLAWRFAWGDVATGKARVLQSSP